MTTHGDSSDEQEARRRFALHQAVQAIRHQTDQGTEDIARQVLILARTFEAYISGEQSTEFTGPLSRQQARVLQLLAEGLTISACAHRLEVCESTVKSHIRTSIKRLGAGSRIEAILVATRLGLLGGTP